MVDGDVPLGPPVPSAPSRMVPNVVVGRVSVRVEALSEISGLVVVLVKVPPLKTESPPVLEVTVAPFVMVRSGPARTALAARPGTPEVPELNTPKIRPNAVEPPMGFVPPTVTDPPLRLMSGELVVLLKLDRWTATRSKSAVIVLFVA